MELRIERAQGQVPVTVVHVQGQVNLGTADQLEQAVRAEYDKGMRNLLIDLSETTSLTSAGFRVLHALYLLLEQVNPGAAGQAPAAHLKLLNPPPDLRRVIRIAGFDSYLPVCDDRTNALASFA